MKKELMTRTPSGRLREPNLNLELPLGGKKMRKLGCKALTQSSSSYEQLQSAGVNVASGWQDPPSPHNPHPHPGAEKVKTSPVSWFGDFCSLPGAYEATERNDARILEEEEKKINWVVVQLQNEGGQRSVHPPGGLCLGGDATQKPQQVNWGQWQRHALGSQGKVLSVCRLPASCVALD